MTVFESIVLGIVQGLTEFLPISSTAHLRVVPALLGWKDPGAAWTAVVQLGTILAVLIYFRADLVKIAAASLRGLSSRQPLATHEGRLGIGIVLGTVPIVALGLAFKSAIEHELRSLWVVSSALISVAFVMAWAERRAKRAGEGRTEPTIGDALVIGLAQACALVPGVSRSGSTISAGLLRGLDRAEAARFSFLLSIPAITGAGLKELHELSRSGLGGAERTPLVVGTVVSFVVGYAAIAGLMAFLRSHSTWSFIVYRVLLGALLVALLAAGVLDPAR